jgi:hypothetical protein
MKNWQDSLGDLLGDVQSLQSHLEVLYGESLVVDVRLEPAQSLFGLFLLDFGEVSGAVACGVPDRRQPQAGDGQLPLQALYDVFFVSEGVAQSLQLFGGDLLRYGPYGGVDAAQAAVLFASGRARQGHFDAGHLQKSRCNNAVEYAWRRPTRLT